MVQGVDQAAKGDYIGAMGSGAVAVGYIASSYAGQAVTNHQLIPKGLAAFKNWRQAGGARVRAAAGKMRSVTQWGARAATTAAEEGVAETTVAGATVAASTAGVETVAATGSVAAGTAVEGAGLVAAAEAGGGAGLVAGPLGSVVGAVVSAGAYMAVFAAVSVAQKSIYNRFVEFDKGLITIENLTGEHLFFEPVRYEQKSGKWVEIQNW